MKPVNQTTFGGWDKPQEERGDCFAACVASIFEIPLEAAFQLTEIADRNDVDGDIWWAEFNAWLAPLGLGAMLINYEGAPVPHTEMPGYYLATVNSTTLAEGEGHHTVVGFQGKVVHNPNPNDSRNRSDPPEPLYNVLDVILFIPLDPSKIARLIPCETCVDLQDSGGWQYGCPDCGGSGERVA